MSNIKVPCGGFALDGKTLEINENGALSIGVGSDENKGYQYLVTDAEGKSEWADRLAYDNRTFILEQATVKNANVNYDIVIAASMITVGSNVIVEIDGEKYNLTVNEGGSYTVNTGAMSCSFYIGKSGASGYIDIREKTTDVTDGPCFIAITGSSDPAYLKAMFLIANGAIGAEHSVSIYVNEVVGSEYHINIDTTSGTANSQDTIPLALYQTYTVKIGRSDGQSIEKYTDVKVMKADDGSLYIGSLDVENGKYPFCIKDNETNINAEFVKGYGFNYILVTCTSDGLFKTIDPKYIPSNIAYFISSGRYFRTGTDWDSGKDATIANIVSAYYNGGAKIIQSSGAASSVIGASAPGDSSPCIVYYDYASETVFVKS